MFFSAAWPSYTVVSSRICLLVAQPLGKDLWGTALSPRVDHEWLQFNFSWPLDHVTFGRDYPFMVELNAPFRPEGTSFCFYLPCIWIISFCCHIFFCCSFPCLYGGYAFASKIARLRDSDFRKLVEGFPCVPLKQRPHQQRNIIFKRLSTI